MCLLARSTLLVSVIALLSACPGDDTVGPVDGPLPTIDAPVVFDANVDAPIVFDANVDAEVFDAGTDGPVDPVDRYTRLSQTGLYTNMITKTLAAGVREWAPAHVLWSDGAVKHRWFKLPPGTKIDTSDMDHWRFPVGTKFWKEFAVTTDDGSVRVETRLIERLGPELADVYMGAFEWNEAESEALFKRDGVVNSHGTGHDIPAANACIGCHAGQPHRALGFSAVQLSHGGAVGGVSLDSLAAANLLTNPPPDGEDYPVPGNAVERAAIGYLHANCGHCHNAESGLACYNATNLSLRVYTTDETVADTTAVRHNVDVPITLWTGHGFTKRIVPGSASTSGLRARMNTRVPSDRMPPAFTDFVDTNGIALIDAWINAMPD